MADHAPPPRRRGSPVTPVGRPPRVHRSSASQMLGLALVAALDEPSARGATPLRPRSDSALSSDTFDGIYALGDDDVGVDLDVDDVDMDDVAQLDDAFRPSALMDSKLEDVYGRTSDLERMLLSAEGMDEHGADERDCNADCDADAVMAHLAQLDEQQSHAQSGSLNGPLDRDGRSVVVGDGHLEIIAALPPKCANTKRRAHTHRFGDRGASFSFRFAGVASARPASPRKVTSTSTTQVKAVSTARRARSLFFEAAVDIARRDLRPSRQDDRDEDHDMGSALDPVATTESEQVEMDKDETVASSFAATAVHTTIESVSAPLPLASTPVRPTVCSFETPQRPPSSANAALASSSFLTPSVDVAAAASAAGALTTSLSISPAPSFEKVAVVHAKDTPGKVDKFEWTIRNDGRELKQPAHSPTNPHFATPGAETLPPRYLADPTSAPQKRLVHSSTFGSFARSFSFASMR